MAFGRDVQAAAFGFIRAGGFVIRHGMGWMFLVPILLWALLSFGLVALLRGPVDELGSWLAQWLEVATIPGSTGWWSAIKAFINGASELLLGVLLKLLVLYVMYLLSKYIVLILLSPLLAYASERTEEILSGRYHPFSWLQLMKDAFHGALLALRNGLLEIGITVLIALLTLLVPILAPVSFVGLFLISAYFYGFSMFDYVYERRRMRLRERVHAVNERPGAVLTNGALFSILMKIPLLGILFAPVLASVGACMATLALETKQGS